MDEVSLAVAQLADIRRQDVEGLTVGSEANVLPEITDTTVVLDTETQAKQTMTVNEANESRLVVQRFEADGPTPETGRLVKIATESKPSGSGRNRRRV
jgi:hypothetical protein